MGWFWPTFWPRKRDAVIVRVGAEIWIDESTTDAKGQLLMPQYRALAGNATAQANLIRNAFQPRLSFCDADIKGVVVLPEKGKRLGKGGE